MYDICHITSEYYFGIHSKEYVLRTLLPGGWEWGRGWGISFIFTSGQHSQLINCTHKYFCCSYNLYYIRDCFFKRFFFCCISLLNYCNVHLHQICAKKFISL